MHNMVNKEYMHLMNKETTQLIVKIHSNSSHNYSNQCTHTQRHTPWIATRFSCHTLYCAQVKGIHRDEGAVYLLLPRPRMAIVLVMVVMAA